jgi:hypothetical protein
MTKEDNVIPFPRAARSNRISGSAEAAASIRAEFRQLGRAQRETFAHLARHTFGLVEELKATFGERSGKMQRAFGELLKQKQRFILTEDAEPHVLCQNPGNWMQVLRGLAIELGRNPDRALLEAFRGTSLMPTREAHDATREQWLGSFRHLMERLTSHLAANHDFPALTTYMADSGLLVENGQLEVCETQSDAIGIEADGLYTPAVLSGLPHVMGLNYRSRLEVTFEAEDGSLLDIIKAAGLDVSIANEETGATLRGGTRTGLAFVLDAATGVMTIALAEWEVLELVFDHQTEHERPVAVFRNYQQLGFAPGAATMLPPNSVRFSMRGAPDFDAIAASHIIFPEIWLDRPDFAVWDPGSYVTTVEDFPSEAPARTVAAVIERNLVYATDEHLSQRIDRILLSQLEKLDRLVRSHREAAVAPARRAQRPLLQEWDASSPALS